MLRTLTKVHFTERELLIAYEPSLRTLQQIVEHPRFGKVMRKLTLCFLELPRLASSRSSKLFVSEVQ